MPMTSQVNQSTLRPQKTQRGFVRLGAVKFLQKKALLPTFLACVIGTAACGFAQSASLQTNAAGVTIAGAATPFHAGLGNVNGLGIGTPSIGNPSGGLTVIATTGGVLYYTPYTIVLSGANNGHHGEVRAYVSSNFTTSSSVIQLRSCPVSGACTADTSYTALPTSAAGEIVVLASTATNGNYTAYLGLFVANTNGIATTANDSATITFDVWDASHNTLQQTIQLKLDNPAETVQTALKMVLASSTGLTITPTGSTPDFTASFGNVNGLGINPAAGLTIVNGQVANGALYTTPYLIKPTFSGFNATSGTTISTYVSTDFVHSTILKLYDSGSSGSGYGSISKNSGLPTQITNSVTSGSSITRYLGLFVASTNAPGIVTGSPETATLTYTITVQ
jgi:hypothetical protein